MFFFSSRRRHTRFKCDWSSDVCSSDLFAAGETVDQESLKLKGLAKGPADGVRILGTGEVTKKLTVKAHHFSKSAAEKIAVNGGTRYVIPTAKRSYRNKLRPQRRQDAV